ncbi:LOW QUALITY PROTEIN: intermembrane lipid transfer protein VPS13D-like [Babylonia areolata]|uniref:LOW QUALITY PROTEIN: intermembrane lipid transfer protein VPS13D-like n=1 Tax=Babylonia areolata TaxID=304850 RepID=UPI003FD43B63
MLEGLAAWVLNTYVGEYVENLNTAQLSIALMQGAVELENLPLKKDALKSLDIPLEVKSGLIGKITLHIPLRRLRSEPWVISIEKLYLVAGPLSDLKHDEELEKKQQQDVKKAMLEALETKWQVLRQTKQPDSGSWFSYGASMAANILENIQLNVKDVHLRYEDDKTNPACPFACGITIKKLSVHSTDSSWVPKFVSHDAADTMYKLVDLQSLAVYCDSNISTVAHLPLQELLNELQRDMYRTKDNQFKDHEYILKPINSQARVKRCTSALPLRSVARPRITVDLSLDTMAFCLATSQYRSLLLWHREFSRHNRRRKFRRFRPACAIHRNGGEWWRFAILSHVSQVQERNRRQTWGFLIGRIHQVVVYSRLYADHLMGGALTSQQQTDKDTIEEELEYEELRIIRERIFFKLCRENKLLFEISKKSPEPESSQQSPDSQQSATATNEGGGLFRSWFPGWSGWYQSTPAPETSVPAPQPASASPASEPVSGSSQPSSDSNSQLGTTHDEEAEIEQEILDVIHDSSQNSSFLRKDTVFARMSFVLKTGSFKLVENFIGDTETGSCPLAELQCTTINMEFESRPRTSAMKFSLAVGSLYLEDLSSKNTVFPYLICPQSKEPLNRSGFNPILQTRAGEKLRQPSTEETSDPKWQFFKLVYEKNPLSSHFKYKACVTTRPIDIIYTPTLLRRLKEVFTVPSTSLYKAANAVSSWQFEKLRKQTQEELKNTLDQLLEAEHDKGRWYIDLDISAPKLIVPENVLEANTALVVMDLGNFRFKTVSAEDASAAMEEEEDFVTPLSTPPNEAENQEAQSDRDLGKKDSSHQLSLSDANVMERLYEKYKIELTEMQVLTGRLHDNWRHAYARGSSQMHILDRFSISMQLDRRLILTADPHWPAATVSGTLPSLTFHLNERKIQALQTCVDTLSTSTTTPAPLLSSQNLSSSGIGLSSVPSLPHTMDTAQLEAEPDSPVQGPEDNHLFLVQFLIHSMSLELQSQGKALVELQVTRVQASAQKKPDYASVALTVHSLLVVDALQSYGQDFELLVASHHNVQLDSRSGSIMGSEVNSPVSPQSPSSPASPRSPSPSVPLQSASFSSLQAIQDALTSAFHSVMPNWQGESKGTAAADDSRESCPKSEALISLEFEIISPSSSSARKVDETSDDTEMRILNLQFNSLDFIANQETLVEILGFLKRSFPTQDSVPRHSSRSTPDSSTLTVPSDATVESSSKLFINADFKRLNVLLLRFLQEDGDRVARKVATATMSSAKVQATLDEWWQVEGSLGGLHLLDVVPEGTRYQQVISIGQGQCPPLPRRTWLLLPPPAASPQTTSPSSSLNTDMFKTAMDEKIFTEVFHGKSVSKVACRFSISKRGGGSDAGGRQGSGYDSDSGYERREAAEVVEASFDMASLCYIHCPKFLDELVDCVSEFRDYVTSVASSIKTAATEVAMGMVGGGRLDTNLDTTTTLKREQSLGDITNTILLQEGDNNGVQFTVTPVEAGAMPVAKGTIVLSARMETPIIVIPRKPNSPQVLLAHLGEISVDNTSHHEDTTDDTEEDDYHFRSLDSLSKEQSDKIFISLTNMNLYSVDFDKHKKLGRSLSSSSFSGFTHELGVPILYDTAVDLYISKNSFEAASINHTLSGEGDVLEDLAFPHLQKEEPELQPASSVLEVGIKISKPIQLGLSKEVYEQILQTSDHLTYEADTKDSGSAEFSGTVPSSTEEQSGAENSGGKMDPLQGLAGSGMFGVDKKPLEKRLSDRASPLPGSVHKSEGDSSVDNFMAKHVKFQVPLFEVELRGDFGEGEQGLVDLKLYDFALDFEKNDRATTHLKVRLKSLQMDDLLEPPDSAHRQIIVSRNSRKEQSRTKRGGFGRGSGCFMSTSCPDCTIVVPEPQMPPSLPSSFNEPQSSKALNKIRDMMTTGTSAFKQPLSSSGGIPGTPPPTPQLLEMVGQQEHHVDDLVHIDVVLVDRKQPEFVSQYNRTNRFIDVEFSCLDTTINLQTWVVLLDFLGMGAKVHDDPDHLHPNLATEGGHWTKATSAEQVAENPSNEVINSEIKFRVESFTLILNKSEYELARATASNLDTQISLRDGNMALTGQLGALSLQDQSPHGTKYSQRFVSIGKQVMQFKFFKYGLPDFAMTREFDLSLTLKMSSIRYVHTNRFQSELVAFCQHFLQLQDVLGRMRAASAGQKINDKATRGARIKLDIEADSPILLIPESSRTDHVLVADLGRLRLTNQFIMDGEKGTLRYDQAQAAAAGRDVSQSRTRTSSAGTKNVQDMTESVFEHCYPPTARDPMTASVYGSLDEDPRFEGLEMASTLLVSESDTIFSPERGSSVDPNAAGRTLPVPPRVSSDPHLSSSGHSGGSRSAAASSSGEQDGEEDVYHCLLDVMEIRLSDIDLLTAKRVAKRDYQGIDHASDMEFTSYIVQIESGHLLKEKIQLDLHVEHNLEGDVSHSAPDWCAAGQLSSVCCHLDVHQYQLVRGLLAHNLGEKVEEFQTPLMSHLQDPRIQTVLSGDVWKSVSLVIQLHNVTVELLTSHAVPPQQLSQQSLARLDFIRSRLSFESYSDQSKDIDLVSHEIVVSDTRFKEEPVNSRPNVFTSILQPQAGGSRSGSGSGSSRQGLQMEMHFRSSPDSTSFTVLLNNMRVMCIFDWLLSLQEFLMTEPPNPFVGDVGLSESLQRQMSAPAHTKAGSRTQSPLTTSRGIATKRGPLAEEIKVPFELRLNVSDTQFVVVENSTSLDTNAVILKSTAVLTFKPQAADKVLRCSLGSLEVFSCCLMAEEDTALSIIDPMTISIELNANPLPETRPTAASAALGLLAVPETQLRQLLLEVSFNTMNIRVSYHDMVMFLAIMNSLPGQALQAKNRSAAASTAAVAAAAVTSPVTLSSSTPPAVAFSALQRVPSSSTDPQPLTRIDSSLERLQEMGFSTNDCRRALRECEEDLNLAALWLSVHATPVATPAAVGVERGGGGAGKSGGDSGDFSITAVELKASSVCLCLIDDCGDADVPLAEISCNAISVHQTMEPSVHGKASFQLVGEYYNRNLSGWEPFLEPWRCSAEWKQYKDQDPKMAVQILAADILNVNLTRTLLELYDQTKGSWTEDYLTQNREDQKKQKRDEGTQHRRSRFIPYVIRNDTGSPLWFMTATSTPTSLLGERPTASQQLDTQSYIRGSSWERVGPTESKPFHFHRREKLRHKKTHDMHINQLVVMVDGWQKLSPVSVDKVGVYFRHAAVDSRKLAHNRLSARVVLDVQQEGSARKLIVVRSALVLVNKLDSPVELKMENTDERGKHVTISLPIGQPTPIPLSCVNSRLLARPSDWQVHYCNRPLQWQHVMRPGEYSDGIRSCNSLEGHGVYRFCVSVLRENYPEDNAGEHGFLTTLPGHQLTLLPPVTIINLLPLELHFYLKGTQVSGNLKPGREAALHGVDLDSNLELGIHLENFSQCRELVVPPNTARYKVKLRVYDSKNRLLELIVRICTHRGGALRLTIAVPFWLVNKSGLPLVFKQEGTRSEGAGQFEEHEQARSVTPLLFSFSDHDEPNLCQMRVGKSVFGASATPHWCNHFSLDGGIAMRQLHVRCRETNRPDWLVQLQAGARRRLSLSQPPSQQVYNIGIQVTSGRGRYRDTNIVTFAPRFEIDNQSRWQLAIAQKHTTMKEGGASVTEECLTALPLCKLPFHWPRVDFDQLLCVRVLDHPSCRWSGGFHIDRVDSFHVNMRDSSGQCLLLKVEVVIQGPTFFIVFADADVMPPPFRLDNLTDLQVRYHQHGVNDDRLKAFLPPHSATPYSWDEPTLNPLKLQLQIPGGTSATYSLDRLEEGEQLQYENFIYLIATPTFDKSWPGPDHELVLDCVHGNNIVFKRKEKGKRSQLWRMTGSGMLEHEGSMSPRDPSKARAPSSAHPPTQGFVLDISDIAPQPGRPVPLVLKKPDERRRSTQTWRFTQDGMLCCHAGAMCIQTINGVEGLQDGALAVLGPGPEYRSSQGSEVDAQEAGAVVPLHMLVSRQKLRPGSGCLSVRVTMDGPIRVLEIVDIQHRKWLMEFTQVAQYSMLWVQKQIVRRPMREKGLEDWEVYDEVTSDKASGQKTRKAKQLNLEVCLSLRDGIGISLVNSTPEELVYVTLRNIQVEIASRQSHLTCDVSVADVKVDNQLFGAVRPVMVYVTPNVRRDVPDNTPALHINAYKVPSAKWNAEIFKHLYITTKRLTVHLEERLLWKLLQFAGFKKDASDLQRMEDAYDTHRALSAVTSIQSKRYYFGTLKLSTSRVTLSMVTSGKLPPDLKVIKHALSVPLIAFEEAKVDLDPYTRYHPFETSEFLFSDMIQHYTRELKGQAAKILGSVDFLGNPLGLFNDVTEGISGLINDGNVGGLLKNVTHGVSNTTAKFATTMSDGLGTLSMDESHNRTREELRSVQSGRSSDHLVAGIKGFGIGLLGGVTSIASQTIKGTRDEGLGGLLKGMGKGVLGTVTKPVSGVLDLTSGVANALRDTSRGSSHKPPPRRRTPRCCHGPGGLLPLYSATQAGAQHILYELNQQDYSEFLVVVEQLRSEPDSLHALVSSRQVIFLNHLTGSTDNIVLSILLQHLSHCKSIEKDGRYYVELTMKAGNNGGASSLRSPQVRCDRQQMAVKVAQEIKYAKNLYDEKTQTLREMEDVDDTDW